MMNDECTVVVGSTDSYSDCWYPFFTLWARHWPDCPFRVVLVTERAQYDHPGLTIRCAQVAKDGERLAWSDALGRALDEIGSRYVLWTTDDLFLQRRVDTAEMERLLALADSLRLAQLLLAPIGPDSAYALDRATGLWSIHRGFRYYLSLMPALWDRVRFRSLLRRGENPWQMELLGSRRARRQADRFMSVAPSALYGRWSWPMDPYTTGITKGRWEPDVVRFFAAEGLAVDLVSRGLRAPAPPVLRRIETVMRVLGEPRMLLRYLLAR
jgi:hypothetical protein